VHSKRARKTLDSRTTAKEEITPKIGDADKMLLAKYVEAWERADVAMLVSLLREDAKLAMPPFREWLRGAASVGDATDQKVFKGAGRAGLRMLATRANGLPAFAIYYRDLPSQQFLARGGLQMVEIRDDKISHITAFIDMSLVELFGLPASLSNVVEGRGCG
jgi:RNA polymerase sigma-70 factor, ECF subfamily